MRAKAKIIYNKYSPLPYDAIMTDRIVLPHFPHEGQHEDSDSDCADVSPLLLCLALPLVLDNGAVIY